MLLPAYVRPTIPAQELNNTSQRGCRCTAQTVPILRVNLPSQDCGYHSLKRYFPAYNSTLWARASIFLTPQTTKPTTWINPSPATTQPLVSNKGRYNDTPPSFSSMSGQIHCEFHHVGLPKSSSKTAIHLLGRNTSSQYFDNITTASGLSHVFSAPPSSPIRDDLVYRTSYHAEEGLIVLAYIPRAEGEGKLDVRSSGGMKKWGL